MRLSKLRKLNILTMLALLIAVVCVATGATFAATEFSAKQNYALDSATNYFSLQPGDNTQSQYYDEFTLTAGQTSQSVDVYNHILNSAEQNPSFDLLAFAQGDTVVTLAGYTATVKDSDDGKCYVFRGVSHSSPSASGGMSILLSISDAVADDTLKVVVLEASDDNVYLSSFFELQLGNSETHYNTFYEQDYGTWTEAARGEYTVSGEDITISGIGTFGFYDAATSQTNSQASLVGTLADDILTMDFDSLALENGMTVAGSNKFVFTLENGYYENAAYGLRVALDAGIFSIEYLPYTNYGVYKNLYFTKSITVEHEFSLNIPCKINLLYSTLTLDANMDITHHYGGSYSIDAITTGNTPIDNTNHTLSINCPRAYYYTGLDGETAYGVRTLVTAPEHLNKASDCVDFTSPENASLLTALANDAKNYFTSYTPSYTWSDFILPNEYHNYGITYVYSSDSAALDKIGNVTRGTDNETANLTATLYFNGTSLGSATKTLTIVGTSDEAKMTALTDLFRSQIYKSTSLVGENHVLDRNIEMFNLLIMLVSANEGFDITAPFTISGGLLPFVMHYVSGEETLTAEAFTLEVTPTTGTITLKDGDTVVASTAQANVRSLYLEKPTFVVDGGNNAITFSSVGTTDKSVNVHLNGMTFNERTAFVERYIETLYLTGSNVPFDILQVANNGMYRGTVAGGNRVLDSTLGATEMVYTIYQMTDADYDAYNGGTALTELASREDKTSLFSVIDGQIWVGAINAPEGFTLVMIITLNFDSDTVGEQTYVTHRTIILPASGIGGTDYTQYTSGNTYAEYFESLTNNRLIDSTADSVGVEGTGYEFKTFASGVSLEMSVVNDTAVVNDDSQVFCSLVYNEKGKHYQIDIDTDEIPARNTTVQLQVVFYIQNGLVRTDISTQFYSFIIPGIYKQGRDITSPAVFARMLEEYSTTEEVDYLLVDDAQAIKNAFDCSLATLDGVTATDTVDLKGIELLSGTASMTFENVKIASLEPFSQFETHTLTTLNLQNCSLTDAQIIAPSVGGGRAYLYSLHITSIDLDNNALTTLTDANGNTYLYRTVSTLSLAEQRNGAVRCLNSIEGIDKLPSLSVLDVSGNAVASFEPLVGCGNLTAVTLDDNDATEFSGKTTSPSDSNVYYGSSGKINVPVFVALRERNVTISGDSQTLFTTDERLLALILNAVSYFYTQYDAITFPTKTYSLTTGGTEISISIVYVIESSGAITYSTSTIDSERCSVTSASLADGDKVEIIASVTDGTTTVYKQFSFLYKEVTA